MLLVHLVLKGEKNQLQKVFSVLTVLYSESGVSRTYVNDTSSVKDSLLWQIHVFEIKTCLFDISHVSRICDVFGVELATWISYSI